jgi:hypothetical protein
MPVRSHSIAMRGIFLALALIAAGAAMVSAQVDHSTVIRVLREGRNPRARASAAIALGSSADPSVAPYLITALSSDDAAVVRTAAATSLGRLGTTSALPALRRALNDRVAGVRTEAQRAIQRIDANRVQERPQQPAGLGGMPVAMVPAQRDIAWPMVRYVVVVGPMQNRSTFREAELDQVFTREVMRNLVVLRGVAVFREGQQGPEADREIRQRRLSTLRLDGSITRVDRRAATREVSVRSEVSLLLMDHPGRNLRSMLNGAATAAQPARGARAEQERELAAQALTGAVRSAMSGAARAIAAAGRR